MHEPRGLTGQAALDAEELDNQIHELEHRLERLRALYEQYFLGIEKIEPQVARKDVDRRFWALRKIKIRNTARRFKLQTLIQRYNTFQQHWGRICREIENGTYRRQMLRAERRMSAVSQPPEAGPDSRRSERAAAAQQAVDEATNDLAALMDGDLDLAAEAKRALEAVSQPSSPRAPTPAAVPAAVPAPKIPTARPAALDKLELDDLDLGPQPHHQAPRLTPAGAVPAATRRGPPPAAPAAPRPPPRTAPPAPAAPGPVPQRPAPAQRPVPQRPAPAQPGPAPSPAVARPPAPARPLAPPAGPSPEAPQRPQPTRPIRSAVGGSARASEIFGGAPPARAPARPAPSAASGLSEDRVKAVHAKLMATKRQLNEQSGVSVGGLKKQLEASYQKLQAKHRGKQIDFDVVVKDGKAVVKPKIR